MVRRVRHLYSHVVPAPIRKTLWWFRNLAAHAVSDPLPVAPTMDYARYWAWRAGRDDVGTTHPELVSIWASIIPQGTRVFDVGCGTGDFLAALRERAQVECVGIDVSEEAVALARQRGIEAYVVDVTAEPITYTADYVTSFEVLEHLPNPEQLLLNLRHLDCPVIISIPNSGHIDGRVRMLAGRFPRQWIYHPGEHLRYWTLQDFRVMSRYLGYRIERTIPLKGPPFLMERWPSLFASYLVFFLRPIHAPES